MAFDFKNRTVLITGAGGAIGRATTKYFSFEANKAQLFFISKLLGKESL